MGYGTLTMRSTDHISRLRQTLCFELALYRHDPGMNLLRISRPLTLGVARLAQEELLQEALHSSSF